MSFWNDVLDLANAPGSAESLRRAINLNEWSNPFSSDKNSFDQFAGGFSADNSDARGVGRAVGSYFAGSGISDLVGGGAPIADSTASDVVTGPASAPATTPTAATGTATQDIIPNSGPGTTDLAKTAAQTPTEAQAQNLIQTSGPTPTPSPADAAQYGLQPNQYVDPATGSTVTPGPGSADVAAQPGIIDRMMNWSNQGPGNAMVTGQAVAGVGKAALGTLSAQQKRKADLEALAAKHGYDIDIAGFKQRQTQANRSVGGGGVNLNLAPGNDVLRRPDGTPVFTNGGILNRNMNGVRG